MIQLFVWFPEFAEFTESSVLFRKNSNWMVDFSFPFKKYFFPKKNLDWNDFHTSLTTS